MAMQEMKEELDTRMQEMQKEHEKQDGKPEWQENTC